MRPNTTIYAKLASKEPHVFLPIEVAVNGQLGTTGDMYEVWIQARRYAGLFMRRWQDHKKAAKVVSLLTQ